MDAASFGPDYFRCEKLACILQRRVCAARQEQALSFDEWNAGRRDQGKKVAFAMCADCAQGREIRKGEETMMTDKNGSERTKSEQNQKEPDTAVKNGSERQKPEQNDKERPTADRPPCRNCGRPIRPGYEAMGLCSGCYNVLQRERKTGASPEAAKKALAAAAVRFQAGPEASAAYRRERIKKHRVQAKAAGKPSPHVSITWPKEATQETMPLNLAALAPEASGKTVPAAAAPMPGGPISQEEWLRQVDAAPEIPEAQAAEPARTETRYVRKHRICANCGRTMLLKARGLCGGCYTVWQRCTARGDDPETLAHELKTAAARFLEGREATRSFMSAQAIAAKVRKSFSEKALRDQKARDALAKVPAAAPSIPTNPDHPTPEAPVMAGIDVENGLVVLHFEDRDKDLWKFLRADATRLRRTPDQQILWILEAHMQAAYCFGQDRDGYVRPEVVS